MTSVITGITGFVGDYLTKLLLARGEQVAGVDQWPQCRITGISYSQINILDSAALAEFFARAQPAAIYHLAGISYLPDADATPRHALETNILGAASLLDAVRKACPRARTLLVGSSKEYGSATVSEHVAEDAAGDPTDFYGISKYAAQMIGRQYVRQFGMDVRFSRSFNHTGPGQSPKFVCSDWARQVAAIELGQAPPKILVGATDHHIDFSDVRDVVEAYRCIIDKGSPGGVYNVCSGQAVALEYVLDYLVRKTGGEITIQRTEQKQRSHKASPRIAGSNEKLRSETGWRPAIPLEKTLDDLFAYWIEKLRSPG